MTAEEHDLPTRREELDGLAHWSVIRAAQGFEHHLGALLAPLELTPVQFGALAHLSIEPSLTQARLAQRILMRPQSMNHLLDGLIRRGLVERTGARGSGRPNPVRLTAAGRDLLAKAWPVVVAADSPEAMGLSATASQQLRRAVARVLDHQAAHPDR